MSNSFQRQGWVRTEPPWWLTLSYGVHRDTSLYSASCTSGLPYPETEAEGNSLAPGLPVEKSQSQTSCFMFLGTEQFMLNLDHRTHTDETDSRGCMSKSQECLLAQDSGCKIALRKCGGEERRTKGKIAFQGLAPSSC